MSEPTHGMRRWPFGDSEMADAIRAHDWSSTALGAIDAWPQSLRAAVDIMLESALASYIWWGPDLIQLYNDRAIAINRAKHPRALGLNARAAWADVWDGVSGLVEQVIGRGHAVLREDLQMIPVRGDPTEAAWFTLSFSPLRDGGGRVAGLFITAIETTTRVRAEEAVRAGDRRIRQLFAQAPGVMCILRGPTHVFEFVNHSYQRLVGDRELLGKTVRDALPEIEGQGFLELLDNVYRTGEPFTAFSAGVKLRRVPNGPLEDRFVDFIYQPMLDATGDVMGIFVEAFDVTDRIKSEERWKAASNRMQVMVAELQHRTRNLVAVVKVLADRTLDESRSLDEFKLLYGDRLAAVSRVQGLLSRLAEGERITFDQVLQAELSALAAFAETSARVTLDGPSGIGLRSNTVQTLALALHELLTNALKYGALAVPDGRLNIHWHVDASRADQTRMLHVDWRESGVPMSDVTSTPQAVGYGRELIERALPYQLMAQTSYDLGADGVRCTIDVPLSA